MSGQEAPALPEAREEGRGLGAAEDLIGHVGDHRDGDEGEARERPAHGRRAVSITSGSPPANTETMLSEKMKPGIAAAVVKAVPATMVETSAFLTRA